MQFEYDASQDACPLPLVKLRVILKKMTVNDTCMIRIADKGSKQDIPKLLTQLGYHFTRAQIDSQVVELIITNKSKVG